MQASRSWQDIRKALNGTHAPAPRPTPEPARPAASRPAPDNDVPFNQAIGEVKRVLGFVAFFSFIINILMLVGPIYMMQVYDRVLSSGSAATLLFLTLAAGALILVSALLEGTRSRVLVRLGGRFDELLSGQLFSRFVTRNTTGGNDNEASLRDLDTVRGFLTGSGLFFFFDAPWTPIFLAVIFALHPVLFAVALVGAVVLFILAIASEVFTRRPLTQAGTFFSLSGQFAANVHANADTVQAMGMLPGLLGRWQAQYRRGLMLQSHASDRAGLLTAATKFVRPALQIAILGVGAWLALNQQISGGAMIAASIMMGRALAPVEGAIGNWRSFVMARGAYARIRAALTAPRRNGSGLSLPKPKGVISVERLVGAAPGMDRPVIKGISFGLNAGDALGMIGPSASGKSTLARLMIGAWQPMSGCARLDGADVAEWNRTELGPHIGYLSQNIELFDGTIAENIARFGSVQSESIIAAAKHAGVHEMILRLPDGYGTRVGPGGMVLSGGQRQRIGLARAIHASPALVVLDEPNSNLDGQGEAALVTALKGLKERGTTLVLITHRAAILDVVDKIIVLRDGAIDLAGSRQEVLYKLSQGAARPSAPPKDQRQLGGSEASPAPRATGSTGG